MECENFLCVYQKDDKCILDRISLDVVGHCLDCIYVDIEPELLKELKDKQLKQFAEYDKTSF